jgi:hypothetical protein
MRKQNCALLTMGSLRENNYYSGFDPRDVPGCALWLDGADPNGNGILPSNGATVTTWVDKTVSGNSMTAAGTPTFQTSPSRISLNGSSYLQTLNLTTAVYTCFYVFQKTSSGGPLFTTSATTFDVTGLFPNENGTTYLCRSDATWYTQTSTIPDNQINLLVIQYDSSGNIYVWLNGVLNMQTTTSGSITRNRLTLGVRLFNNQYMTGSYYEVIQMNSALTTSQRQQVEGYLAWKWGLIPRFQNPTSIPGCTLWLDAADPNTVVRSGSTVTQWIDKSGIGNHTTATSGTSTYTSNAINNVPAILMGSSYFTGSFASTYTGTTIRAFAVATMNNASGHVYGRILSLGRPGVTDYGDQTTLLPLSRANGQNIGIWRTGISTSVNVPAYDTPFLVRSANVGSNISIAINGGSDSTISAGTSVGFNITHYCVGANVQGPTVELYGGYIGEIICYTSALTTAQIQQVEGYLADKWGLRAILPGSFPTLFPASHPFYRSLPYTRAFNPLDIAGCTLWLDGADGGSMTLSGSNVTQWNDKSGLGCNATASGTPALLQNSLNSNSVVYFNGTSYFTGSQSDTNSTHSVLAVVRFNSGGPQYARLVSFGVNGAFDYNNAAYYNLSSNTSTLAVTRNGVETNVGGVTSDAYHIVTAIFNGTNGLYYVDGGMLSNSAAWTSNFNFNQYRVGADQIPTGSQQLQGNVGEIIAYSNALSTTERMQLESYLGWKWNISNQIRQPTDIPGCMLWLDAADSNTLFQDTAGTSRVTANGNTIRLWRDKSSFGSNATQSGNAPVWNSSGFVRFAMASSQFMSLPNGTLPSASATKAYSIFAVSRVTRTDTLLTLICSGTAANNSFNALQIQGTSIGNLWYYNDIGGGTVSANVLFLASISYNGSQRNIYQNGTNVRTATSTAWIGSSVNNVIGVESATGNWYFDGDIGEIIVFPSELSTSQRQQIEKYLARKWSLPVSISSSTLSLDIPPRTTAFSPPQISGLQMWLDAADATTLSFTGTTVSQWRDKSGLGNHMAPTSSTYRTAQVSSNFQNGLDVLSFAGRTVYRTPSTGGVYPLDAYIVVALKTLTRCDVLAIGSTTSDNFNSLTFSEYTSLRWHNGSSGFSRTPNAISPTNETSTSFLLMNWSIANNNFIIRRNGSGLVSTASYTWTMTSGSVFQIGWRLPWDNYPAPDVDLGVYIAEIVVYSSQLGTAQRQQVEGYLASKWGLQGSLPSTHPYVKITP